MARIKNKQIKFYCTVEDLEKINSNADKFNLATGTYLRLCGLAGVSPITQPSKSRKKKFRSDDVKGSDVRQIEPKKRKDSEQPPDQERAA